MIRSVALAALVALALVGGTATTALANGGATYTDLEAPGGGDASTQPADPDFPGDPPQ